MAELLPKVLLLAPQLAKYLFGARGAQAAAQVASVVQSVTGSVDPEHQLLALTDAGLADNLRLELARLTAQFDVEQRAADMGEIQAHLADVMSARQQTLTLTQERSPMAWGAPIVSVLVLATFGAMLGCLMTFHIPDSALALANVMLGTLGTLTTAVVQYWVGSSSGSRAKDGVIADATRNLAIAAPAVPPPGAK